MKKQQRPSLRFAPSFHIDSDRTVLGICILVSLIFWLFVKLSDAFTTTRMVKVEYVVPPSKSFLNTPPSVIETTVKGTGWQLLSNYFGQRSAHIKFDLPDRPSFTINSSMLENKIQQQLKSLTIIDFKDLDYILINMGETFEKKIPVVFNNQITFAPQHQIENQIILTPDSINISGPTQLIDSISFWSTEPIILNDLKKTVEQTVSLETPLNKEIRFSPSEIEVIIPVEGNTQKDFFVKVQVLNTPDSLTFFPKQIKAHCIVGLSKYKELSNKDLQLTADFKDIAPNAQNNTVPVNLTKPDYVGQVILDKESVEFFFVDTSGTVMK